MGKGLAKATLYGKLNLAEYKGAANFGFIYETSTTKNDFWNIGDRVVLTDGREYRYAKSSAACVSGQGCEFTVVGVNAYTAAGVSQAAGDTQVTIPVSAHSAFGQNDESLRGGYVVIYDGVGNDVQFRSIIGNDATAADVAFVVYLDGPLTEAVTVGTSAIEAFQNPYAGLRTGTSASLPKAGVPAVKVTAALTYFWVQTAGPCWVAPQGTVITKQIGCCWRHDGSLAPATDGIDAAAAQHANVASQYAGYTLEGNYAGIGPLFMLKG